MLAGKQPTFVTSMPSMMKPIFLFPLLVAKDDLLSPTASRLECRKLLLVMHKQLEPPRRLLCCVVPNDESWIKYFPNLSPCSVHSRCCQMEKHYLPIVALLLLLKLRPVGKPAAHIPSSHKLTSRWIRLGGGMHFSSLFSSSSSSFPLQNLHFAHRICGGLDAHTHSQGRYIIARGRAHTHSTHTTHAHTRSWFAPGCSFTWFASHGNVFQSQPNTATIITTRKGK